MSSPCCAGCALTGDWPPLSCCTGDFCFLSIPARVAHHIPGAIVRGQSLTGKNSGLHPPAEGKRAAALDHSAFRRYSDSPKPADRKILPAECAILGYRTGGSPRCGAEESSDRHSATVLRPRTRSPLARFATTPSLGSGLHQTSCAPADAPATVGGGARCGLSALSGRRRDLHHDQGSKRDRMCLP